MLIRNSSERRERGQSLVEFALMLPVLMLILMGTLDLGRLYASFVTVTNAAREGARYGANDPTVSANIKNRAFQEASGSGIVIDPNLVKVEYAHYGVPTNSTKWSTNSSIAQNDDNQPIVVGDQIRVTVSYNFGFVSPFLFDVGTIPVSNSATMTILFAPS